MILCLGLNEMDLQHSKQMLAFLQRQPDHLRQIFGHGRATADLMNANGPVRSDQLQHDPPLHPELPATTTGRSHSTPHLRDGLGTHKQTYQERIGRLTAEIRQKKNALRPVRAADDGSDRNHLFSVHAGLL
jgi:hypothetical protein